MQLHVAKRFRVQQTNSDGDPVHDFYKMNLIKLFYTGFQVLPIRVRWSVLLLSLARSCVRSSPGIYRCRPEIGRAKINNSSL